MQIKVLSFLELVAEAWLALGFWVLMQLPFLDLFEPVLIILLGIGVGPALYLIPEHRGFVEGGPLLHRELAASAFSWLHLPLILHVEGVRVGQVWRARTPVNQNPVVLFIQNVGLAEPGFALEGHSCHTHHRVDHAHLAAVLTLFPCVQIHLAVSSNCEMFIYSEFGVVS